MRFESPWTLLLLLLIPLLLWLHRRQNGRRGAVRFSWTRNAAMAGRSLRQRLAFLPLLLRVLALIALVIAIARPQKGMEQVRDASQGIAIEMVVDRSYSMAAELPFEGRRMNRLDVVKTVFEDFVLGNDNDLDGRPNDLVGLVSFARYPETICPLTLAHGALPRFLDTVRLVHPKSEENRTAIGDAIALAAARLKTAEETLRRQAPDRADHFDIKNKVMILLTDGDNNAGKRSPLEAAQLAKDWGIRIYTVGVGGGEAVRTQNTLLGQFLSRAPGQGYDPQTLKDIARETGGKFYAAEDAKGLKQIYREIDKLERTEIDSLRFMDYRELFFPLALISFLLIVAETVLNCTLFRKVP
jgi:Ca-activated chloride channel family protein